MAMRFLRLLAASAWSAVALQAPPQPGPQPAVQAEVKASTAPVTQSMIYTAEKLRDPFAKASAGGAGGALGQTFKEEDFNIHNLALRGLLKNTSVDYALFTDEGFGISFILRKGRLYDSKGKPVPGVTGSLNLRQKTANLTTQDGDVQTFRLGEEEKE